MKVNRFDVDLIVPEGSIDSVSFDRTSSLEPAKHQASLPDAALDYAHRGWSVIALRPRTKVPDARFCPHGSRSASSDPLVVRSWWEASPTANIGLATGASFDVLDVDGPQALSALETCFANSDGEDVEGPTVLTPRGWHVYLAPTGRGNAVNLGGLAGIDWRGQGGYVVAPPSINSKGERWLWLVTDGVTKP
jgi:hypothetical protein